MTSFAAFVQEFLPAVRQANETILDARVNGARWKSSVGQPLAGRDPGERTHGLIDGTNGVDMKANPVSLRQ